ncbi:HigA family addiction module antitoxin [Paenisporosarcina sp. OV554]|uniref:HigA family addiction module antitoxin n=1 Tax=Paenisporosarcina sp. OV554 TaxID=2135694 RepID=UPI000D3D70FA|nr:HigA family addiction module antitoxin [Paenisporosarcina sp. OV554]PUB18243.1 addiction module HigA family antidote [Paenisporosarcina sp. OV554]
MKSFEKQTHPGTYVRQNIIPSNVTVKAAAERLGIGRPALSNFLNGKSSLSLEMATRLEKAFGADKKQLLDMQAVYNQRVGLTGNKEITVRAFVPNFLTIKARQIEEWANSQIESRSLLPVFLRRLVHSTGNELRQVDFPGYDNGQRKGSDGFVRAGAATPWIPEGESYWEFGTDQRVSGKAEGDYNARLTTVDPSVRANSTFVFVTPRNWTGKKTWETLKNEARDWKAVRVFDADDLEQWLEQSIPTQIWFAEQLNLPISGYETLEMEWSRWANASEPPLTPAIFVDSIAASRKSFKAWINEPSSRPFFVAADSRGEALAFLSCLFEEEEFGHLKDLAAVFTSPETLRTLVASQVPFIPIVHSEDTERELLDAHRRLHCIIFRPRNAVDVETDVKLDQLSYGSFKNALISMGIEEGDVDRLARESGQSPTILRRRLSQNAAIRKPVWAGDDNTAKTLIPTTLIGAWQSESEADREIISKVANRNYEAVEDEVARFLRFDDSPVWSVGHFRGVVSKIDALFAIERLVTSNDLEQFFAAAEYVLSESDPALELPEKDRWAAALYDKTRNHSNALRTGICETLVILSVHGNNLFQSRLGDDVESRVAVLIRKLLTPLTLEKLLSHDRDLPRYAEAAPNEFLKIIKDDLRSEAPVVLGLLKPVDNSLFGVSPSRTGLLWGLECLAWKPQNLPRVALILARLSLPKIDDNWGNKPDASLKAIFRSWMPQTAASMEQRYLVLKKLTKHFSDISWEISIDQIKPGSRIGHYSYRPNWRSDASGFGQVVTNKEFYEFNKRVLDLLITWPNHDEKTLGDLVEALQGMPEEGQTKVWDLIDEWSDNADEASKAVLRERIRQFAFTRRSRHRKLKEATSDRARAAYDSLRVQNPVISHGWLFVDQWVQESSDEIEDEAFDYQKREERIDSLRLEAMFEILRERGFEGVKELMARSGAPGVIGRFVTFCVTEIKQRIDFIRQCLSIDGDLKSKSEWCLQGFLYAIEDNLRTEVLKAAANELNDEEQKRLFLCAPFKESTWRLLDGYNENIRKFYWKKVLPSWGSYTPSELTELVDCLLEALRPHAAFYAVQRNFKALETSRLKRLLYDMATVKAEPVSYFKLEKYHISEAIEELNSRSGVTRDELAQLEFLFIEALNESKHGIPNLEAQIGESPSLFVQAVTLGYNRRDEGKDPLEWKVGNHEQRVAVSSAARLLLERISNIPGTDINGIIDTVALAEWLSEVRRLCHEYGRAEIGDRCLGKLLAKAPTGENGMWPCQQICEAMEEISSSEIARGFSIEVHNSRDAQWRIAGGEQERELAVKYHTWAEQLYFDYPYVGAILEDIAESYNREAKWHDSEANIAKRLWD